LEAIMDPITLATTALAASSPYLVALGKKAATEAAGAAGKSVWDWIKGKLGSEAGKEAVRDLEAAPSDATNRQAVELALSKLLRNDPGTLNELRSLLIQAGAMSVQGDITVTAAHGGVASGGSIIGSTITTGSKQQS
jgi:hypothetical protein